MLEAAVQERIRLRAGELGIHLFRNNVGVAETENGRPIRYGLANDSAQLNKRLKSADLIGILPVEFNLDAIKAYLTCPPEHRPYIRGHSHTPADANLWRGGVFLSVECKESEWHGGYPNKPRPAIFNERERAQQVWIDLVRSQGGIAGFCRCVEEFEELIG